VLSGKPTGDRKSETKRRNQSRPNRRSDLGVGPGLWDSSTILSQTMRSSRLAAWPGKPTSGRRRAGHARLADAGLSLMASYRANSVQAISTRRADSDRKRSASGQRRVCAVLCIHNRPQSGALYEPVANGCWPLDALGGGSGQCPLADQELPEIMGAAPRRCAPISANTFSSRSSGLAPSPCARNASRWRRCNGPTKMTTCWRRSTAPSTSGQSGIAKSSLM